MVEQDPDAILILKFYGPDASATREPIADMPLEAMDEEVADLIGAPADPERGKSERTLDLSVLARLSEGDAERVSREIAAVIRRHLRSYLARIKARRAAAEERRDELERGRD